MNAPGVRLPGPTSLIPSRHGGDAMLAEETLDEHGDENVRADDVEYGSGRRVGVTPVCYLVRVTSVVLLDDVWDAAVAHKMTCTLARLQRLRYTS
jgi:hypothetical protein